MTPEEREHSETLVYQLLPSRYGMNPDDLRRADAIEVVVGQGAKPGGGGMLLGHKISDRVAEMRDLPKGIDQRSACRHPDWTGPDDLEIKIGELREITDWEKPIFVKVGATRTYYDVALAVKAGADVIVVDGMQGGTAATQDVFIEHVGIPTLPAVRARRRGAAGARDAPRGAADRLRRDPHAAPTSRRRSRSAPTRSRSASAALIALGDNSPEHDEEYRELGSAAGFYDDWQAGRDPAGISTQDDELAARFDPVARRAAARELPARADARDADARARLRQVARPQPRARGPRRAHGRGGGDGARAARRHELDSRAATGSVAEAPSARDAGAGVLEQGRERGACPRAAEARHGALEGEDRRRACRRGPGRARRSRSVPARAPRRRRPSHGALMRSSSSSSARGSVIVRSV